MKAKVKVEEAVEHLRRGEVGLVPTETVVGLMATERGVRRIQEIKRRDPNKPLQLLCRSAREAFGLAARVPPLAGKLAELYWPGGLTLVLDRPGGGTVGLRVPDHPTVQRLLEAYGGPVYATSANISGEPAPSSLEEVDPRVLEEVDFIVEGEPGGGTASAVVDLSGENLRVLRPSGELDQEKLERLVREGRV
ncbi:MAG: threonylcarbamoyl-AMP synthase [Rubrobacteraceae bacterium]|nr:threonylcarbamoyl-AMP synthase [Rubrobacteraceae bacterium]